MHLDTLRLSYNKIPPSHLVELGKLRNLRCLEVASNNFCTLPSSLSFFRHLTDLNLSSNGFSSDSVLVSPDVLFQSLNTIPQLTKLNLSRNKLKMFHHEGLSTEGNTQPFPYLEELNFGFNIVDAESAIFYAA